MIVKHFGCTAIHNKALYKCIIHSFIHYLEIVHSPSADDVALRDQSSDLPEDVPKQALSTGAAGEHLPVEVPTECLPDVLKTVEAGHLPDATSVHDQ